MKCPTRTADSVTCDSWGLQAFPVATGWKVLSCNAYLLVDVLAVEVAPGQDNAQEQGLHADGHRLEFPRLQFAAVIAVKGEGPQTLP